MHPSPHLFVELILHQLLELFLRCRYIRNEIVTTLSQLITCRYREVPCRVLEDIFRIQLPNLVLTTTLRGGLLLLRIL